MFFKDDRLDIAVFPDELQDTLYKASELAVESRRKQIRPGHLLLATIQTNAPEALSPVTENLKGCALAEVGDGIKIYLWNDPSEPIPAIDFSRKTFSRECLDVFEDLEALTAGSLISSLDAVQPADISMHHLLYCILRNLDSEDRVVLGEALHIDTALEKAQELLEKEAHPIEVAPIFDEEGLLRLALFDATCVEVLKTAVHKAGQMGYNEVRPPHLFLALIDQSRGTTVRAVRLQVQPGVGIKKVGKNIEHSISLGPNIEKVDLDLVERHFSENVREILKIAVLGTMEEDREIVNENQLLMALLMNADTRLKRVLQDSPLYLDISKMVDFAKEAQHRGEEEKEAAHTVHWPEHICPAANLTALARSGELQPILGRAEKLEEIKQTLFKLEDHNVLLYGEPGVGKTSLIQGLAVEIASGKIDFLGDRPLLSLDISSIGDKDAKMKTRQLLEAAEECPWGIYFIDGIEKLLRADRELFKKKLKKNKFILIGTVNVEAYTDIVARDDELRSRLTSIKVDELSKEETIEILKRRKKGIEKDYNVSIDDAAVARAVKLSHDFIMNERLPTKAIKVLRNACDSARFEIHRASKKSSVTTDHVVKEIARITGLPETMIRGSGEEKDYYSLLSKMIVGQEEAVQAVADRLDLIQKGMVDRRKPAGIFFFVGLTGTGKTELAKAVAQLYSNSKALITFPMENFQEEHSVSGLIGSPPGYVGYDEGGKLINELNADPYSVVLLDEVDKAHPEIWAPFLNLFDEGWISDRRNVVARGNKALFILTSNLCWEAICDSVRRNLPESALRDKVKEEIGQAINPRTRGRCFSPEFLGRIEQTGGIVVFKPLTKEAVTRITELKLQTLRDEWNEGRETQLEFEQPGVTELISKLSFGDIGPDGKPGGRAVVKRIDGMIKTLLAKRIRDFMGAEKVTVYENEDSELDLRVQRKEASQARPEKAADAGSQDEKIWAERIHKKAKAASKKLSKLGKEDVEKMAQQQQIKLDQGSQAVIEALEEQ